MSYYKYATRRDLLDLVKLSGKLLAAAFTLNVPWLDRVQGEVTDVHARISARKAAAEAR